jgi:hypothetical protein
LLRGCKPREPKAERIERYVMEEERVQIEADVLCSGLRRAFSRSEESILCLIRGDRIRFVAVSGLRLIISWETILGRPRTDSLAFVIPPLVAELLSSEVICSLVGVEIAMRGKQVTASLRDHLGSYEFGWASDLSSFPAPAELGEILVMPEELMEVPYLGFSDATHQAVAKLVRMEADEQVSPTKLAILIDLDFGGLRVNGEEIVTVASQQYYFDPRLVIRALELLKEKNLRVGVTPLGREHLAYLSLVAQDEGWTVHCSLLSIGKDTQRLYPLPPGRDR